MLLRRIIGNKYQSSSTEYYRNSFILLNISILTNIDYIVSKISELRGNFDVSPSQTDTLKSIFTSINDVLDEILMRRLIP